MKKRLRRLLPDSTVLHQYRWMRPFAATLGHPALWRFNGHGIAGGVAVGLMCGLIPGPFQMLPSAILCLIFRVNLPVALFTTLYTNPLTIVPIYLAAYGVGCWLLGIEPGYFGVPPQWGDTPFQVWFHAMVDWGLGLGYPLVLGLGVFAVLFPIAGYVLVRVGWRIWLIQRWNRRHRRKR